MDFFGSQDNRKKQSLLLLVCFVAAMLAMAAVIHVVAVFINVPLSGKLDFGNPPGPAKAFIVLIWLTCLAGGFFRILDVKAGGAALAQRFGATEVQPKSRFREETELLNIVDEIGVASATTPPPVFILHREDSINAFVVGGFKGREALVVSQGALEKLDRDQLSAVIAHEYGHITQGDIPVNMRLLVALSSLNAIDEVGKLLMVRSREGELFAQPGVVVGIVLRALGSIGVFFGHVIRSAFSRQREFLADACAVQFTRNPESVASALTDIRNDVTDAAIHGVHAEEITHLCFQAGDVTRWYKQFFATHPPVQKRIDAIDPHYAAKARAKKRRSDHSDKPKVKQGGSAASNVTNINVGNGTTALQFAQAPEVSNSSLAQTLSPTGGIGVLSDKAAMMISDPSSCLAVLHAIFVSDDRSNSKAYYEAIAFAYNKVFAHSVKDIAESIPKALATEQLAIIEHATAQLRHSIKLENRQRLLKSLEKLLVVEGEFTLMNYATLQLVRRKLDAEFPVLETKVGITTDTNAGSNAEEQVDNAPAQGMKVKTFDKMGEEFALLLSLMVESSGNSGERIDEQYKIALACYTKHHHPRRLSNEPGIVKELEAAFQTLYVQPKAIRESFVQHCLDIAQADHHIAKEEHALLNLFAASLNCELQIPVKRAA